MEQLDQKIDGIRKILEEMKDKKYAIVVPELVDLEEYVKSLYLKVLCTVVQYENEPGEMQVLYLKRLINGIGVEEPMEEYMRKALDISETDIEEFLSYMKRKKAKYYFALDAILLVSMSKANPPTYEYLAELVEILEIDKKSLNHLALVAKSVLTQESTYFDSAKENSCEYTSELDFMPYINNFYVGAIVDTRIEKYYASPDIALENEIELPTSFDEKRVTFENLVIKVSQDWHFYGCERVLFKNCKLVGDKGSLRFHSVGTIEFENSSFMDFDNRVAWVTYVNSFMVRNCKFIMCGYDSNGDERGGVFVIDGVERVSLEYNELINCYIRMKEKLYHYGVSGVFIGYIDYNVVREMKVVNNSFIGCRCINNGNFTAALISVGDIMDLTEENNTATGELIRIFEDR